MSARRRSLPPVTAVLFGLTACTSTPALAPLSTAAPSTAAAPTSAPTSAVATRVAPATSRPRATETSDRTARGPKCPSAKALEKLVDLPKDWYFVPSSVECWKGWAWADPEGPFPGDGFYLFRYKAGTGWRYHSQGSGYRCEDLGINETAPFCRSS
jgi:hypothetical protein